MKFIEDIKKLMYHKNTPNHIRFKLNTIIFKYDEQRASTDIEVQRAGKEWEYRIKKLCDYLVKEDF
jgi:hypothetical protein